MSHARPRLASAPFFFFFSSSFIDLVLSHSVSRSPQPPRNNTQESRNCTGCARIIAVARSPAFAFRLFTVLAASQFRAGVRGSGSSRYHQALLPARSTGDQARRRHAKKPPLRRVHAPALLLGSDPSRGIAVFFPERALRYKWRAVYTRFGGCRWHAQCLSRRSDDVGPTNFVHRGSG